MLGRAIAALVDNQRKFILPHHHQSTPNNYAQILESAIQKELAKEIKKIRKLLDPNLIDDELKSNFLKLCVAREKQNQNNYLSYTSIPEGVCNRLYFDIANVLFKPENFFQLMRILLPSIHKRLVITVSDVLNEKQYEHQAIIKRININLETQTLITDSTYPAELSVFTKVVIDSKQQVILMLDDIENFRFDAHLKLYDLLGEYPELMEKLYRHNDAFKQLNFDIKMLGKKAVKPNDVMTEFAYTLKLAGTGYSGREYADDSGMMACHSFQSYLNQLPDDFRQELLEVKTHTGVTLKYVVEKHIGPGGTCVEQASTFIKEIQNNARNHHILNQIPHLTQTQINLIKKKYLQPIPIIGFDNEKTLPPSFINSLIKHIRIGTINDYLSLLIHLPTEVYLNLIKYADIYCYPSLPDELGKIVIEILNEEQKTAFFDAIITQRDKLDIHTVLYFAVKNKLKYVFETIVKATPKEQCKKLFTEYYNNNTSSLLNFMVVNPDLEIFTLAWECFSNTEKLMLINEVNEELPLIHLAAKNSSAATLKIILGCLSEQEIINELNKKSIFHNSTPLQLAIKNKNLDTFQFILDYLKSYVDWKENKDQIILLLQAAIAQSNGNIFNRLWDNLTLTQKIQLLNEKNTENFNILLLSLQDSNLETWKMIWNVYKEYIETNHIINQLNVKNKFLYMALAKNQESYFNLIWSDMDENEQRTCLKMRIHFNRTILHESVTANNLIIFKKLWESLSNLEQLEFANLRVDYNETLYYLAAKTNEPEILQLLLANLSSNIFLDSFLKNNYFDKILGIMLKNSERLNQFEKPILNLIDIYFSHTKKVKIYRISQFYMDVIKYSSSVVFKRFWECLPGKDKELILSYEIREFSALHFALENSDPEIWKIIWNAYPYIEKCTILYKFNLIYVAVNKDSLYALQDIINFMKDESVTLSDPEKLLLSTGTLDIFHLLWKHFFLASEKNKNKVNISYATVRTIVQHAHGTDFFKIIWDYLSDKRKFELLNHIYEETTLLHMAMNSEIFYFLWEELPIKNKLEVININHHLINSENQQCYSLLYWAVKKKKVAIFKVISKFLSKHNISPCLTEKDENMDTIFHHAVQQQDPELFNNLWNGLSPNLRLDTLQQKNRHNQTLLHFVVASNFTILNIIFSSLPKQDIFLLVKEDDHRGISPLSISIGNKNSLTFNTIWKFLSDSEKKILLEKINNGCRCLLHVAAKRSAPDTWLTIWNSYSDKQKLGFFSQKHDRISPVFDAINTNFFAFYTMLEFIHQHNLVEEFFVETKDKTNMTPLELIVSSHRSIEFFKVLWEILSDDIKLKILDFKTVQEYNFMGLLVKKNKDILRYIWEYYLIHGQVRRDQLYFLACNDQTYCINAYLKSLTPGSTTNLFSIICGNNKEGHNLLHAAVMLRKITTARFLFYILSADDKLKAIKIKDKYGNNLLHLSVNLFIEYECLEYLLFVLNAIPKKNMLNYLSILNGQGLSVFHIAAHIHNNLMWDVLLQYIPLEQQCEAVLVRCISHNTPIHTAVMENNPRILKAILELIPMPNRLSVMLDKNHSGVSPINYALKNEYHDILKLMLDYLPPNERKKAVEYGKLQLTRSLYFFNLSNVGNNVSEGCTPAERSNLKRRTAPF